MPRPAFEKKRIVRPDSKGRITLGAKTRGVSSYAVSESADGTITLEPLVEIPAREAWLFKNEAALESVKRGSKQAAEGKVRSCGSFAKHADDDIDE